MVFSIDVIKDIVQRSGLKLDRSKDLDLLAEDIFKVTGRNIGVTTLKRLLGVIRDERKANAFTLNTVALYLGYGSWGEYVRARDLDSAWDYADEAVYIDSLSVGAAVTVRYLDRTVRFEVREDAAPGRKVLEVVGAENSSLLPGDILYVHSIERGRPLKAEKLVRGSRTGTYRTAAPVASVDLG